MVLVAAGMGHMVKEAFYLHDSVVAVVLVLSVAVALWCRVGARRFHPGPRRLWVLSPLPLLVWVLYAYMMDFFGAASLGAFLFHVQMGTEGEVDPEYAQVGVAYLGAATLIALAWLYLANADVRVRRMDRWAAIALFGSTPFFWANTAWPALRDALSSRPVSDADLVQRYVAPKIEPVSAPRNLILIYAESLERTFADPIFGDTYAPLAAVASRGLEFTDIRQIENTGWTMAGIVASQCGVPLMPLGILQGSKFDQVKRFLPGVSCLGDVLGPQGYSLSFLGGADLDFAGKRLFLEQHGFSSLWGERELMDQVPKNYVNRWGLYDDSLFEIAREQIRRHQRERRPFVFSVLTLSAHFPNGYPAQSCEAEQGVFDGENFLYSVECSGRLIAQFVETLQREQLLDNTVVVIMSDHLAMKNSHWDRLVSRPRTNTLIVLDRAQTARRLDRPGSTLDVFPTLLELAGYRVQPAGRAGLGVSLLGAESTLVESMGASALDDAIKSNAPLSQLIWAGATVTEPVKTLRP